MVLADHARLHVRENCNDGYTKCSPKGASATDAPAIGSALTGLFVDLLNSVNKVQKSKRDGAKAVDVKIRGSAGSVCCADGTQCLLLQGFDLPFCYDKFTTNYFLPGGAYGQIVSGNYTSSGGEANLLNGNYTLTDGTSGNIYPSAPAKPDTATLTLPTQYTAAGVGSAIPVSALGQWTTYTTTIPGTTIPPTTIAAHVLAASVVSGSTIAPATTEPAVTLAATTVEPKTSAVTTRIAKATSSQTGAAGAAGREGVLTLESILFVSMLVFLTVL